MNTNLLTPNVSHLRKVPAKPQIPQVECYLDSAQCPTQFVDILHDLIWRKLPSSPLHTESHRTSDTEGPDSDKRSYVILMMILMEYIKYVIIYSSTQVSSTLSIDSPAHDSVSLVRRSILSTPKVSLWIHYCWSTYYSEYIIIEFGKLSDRRPKMDIGDWGLRLVWYLELVQILQIRLFSRRSTVRVCTQRLIAIDWEYSHVNPLSRYLLWSGLKLRVPNISK